MKFELGRLVATPGALGALFAANQSPAEFIQRHVSGDWGELVEEDKEENEYGLKHGLRLMSAFTTNRGTKIWVITEADRSVTTLLLPEEY